MALGVCKAPQGTVHYGEVASYFFQMALVASKSLEKIISKENGF